MPARSPSRLGLDWPGYFGAVAVVALATLIAWPLRHRLGLSDKGDVNILMLYLLGVLWVALRYTRGAATLAAFLAVAAFDFFFVPPYLTFAVADPQYIFTFLVMLVTALTIGTLTNRVRLQAEAARYREHRTQTLLALSRELAAAPTAEDVAAAIVRHVSQVLDARAFVLVADAEGKLRHKEAAGGGAALDAKEQNVADWVHQHGQTAGAGTDTMPAAGTYFSMKTARASVGVLAVFRDIATAWSPEQRQLLEAFASQGAVAVERAMLAVEARQAWERVEAEFLRNTLLSGISHDLRTPLAAIAGAASSLVDDGMVLSESARRDMAETIWGEADRMERLIKNLLDMTRLEAGGLTLTKEWHSIQEIVASVLRHLERRIGGRQVNTELPDDLPLIHIDCVAIEQVLTNLVDNAAEYTPREASIEIRARAEPGEMIVEVSDRGPGLPPGAEQRVFQKFFRSGATRQGIGLGLAICKGIIEAHGGKIVAFNRAGGGACFRFMLPLEPPPQARTAGNAEPSRE